MDVCTLDLYPYFRALADPKRLRMVAYLAQHERVTVSQLGEELRLSQPLISWHLHRLIRAGIARTEREGRLVWCSLDRSALRAYGDRFNRLVTPDSGSDEAAAGRAPASVIS